VLLITRRCFFWWIQTPLIIVLQKIYLEWKNLLKNQIKALMLELENIDILNINELLDILVQSGVCVRK